jgi:hypothetical protein
MRLLWLIFLVSNLQNCNQTDNTIGTFDEFRMQPMESRDSLFVLHTVREWGKQMWWTWAVRKDMYRITPEDVSYFLAGTFYSPDRKKMIVWVGEKMPNAATIEKYSPDDPRLNRICPTGGDTVYRLSALIGIRDTKDGIWNLYPFDQQQATCFNSKEGAINVLGRYYFEKMDRHQMYRMQQAGQKKGQLELEPYGYNLQNPNFWDSCWLFKKDTVGSFGLYPFQINHYRYNEYDIPPCSQKCAVPFKVPLIDYPSSLLKLYDKSVL